MHDSILNWITIKIASSTFGKNLKWSLLSSRRVENDFSTPMATLTGPRGMNTQLHLKEGNYIAEVHSCNGGLAAGNLGS